MLHRVDGGWEVRDGDEPVHRADDDDVRITVSWKGEIYADEADRAAGRSTTPTTSTSTDVVDTLLADMRARGVDVERPADPHHDEAWVAAVSSTYGNAPPAGRLERPVVPSPNWLWICSVLSVNPQPVRAGGPG